MLYQILRHDPSWLFIDELVSRLNDHPVVHGEAVYNDWHVFRQLKVGGFSLKKMRKFASEPAEHATYRPVVLTTRRLVLATGDRSQGPAGDRLVTFGVGG